MGAFFVVSSLGDAPLPDDVSDKTAHLLGYMLLGVAAVRAAAGGLPRRITLRTAAAGIAITLAYAATDELHQAFVPGRTADVADLYADAAGAILAAAACWAWGIISTRSAAPARPSHDL